MTTKKIIYLPENNQEVICIYKRIADPSSHTKTDSGNYICETSVGPICAMRKHEWELDGLINAIVDKAIEQHKNIKLIFKVPHRKDTAPSYKNGNYVNEYENLTLKEKKGLEDQLFSKISSFVGETQSITLGIEQAAEPIKYNQRGN